MKIRNILLVCSITFIVACQQSNNGSTIVPTATDSTVSIKPEATAPATISILNWPRKNVAEIGCIIETEFGYRDPVFNCSKKNYVNKGDPCKNTDAYYEGLVFPQWLGSKIHAAIKDIRFDFEGGRLREIAITFMDSLAKEKIREWFKLPTEGVALPENILSISYGENVFSNDRPVNPAYTRWLNIIGFEHMGAGDVDCE